MVVQQVQQSRRTRTRTTVHARVDCIGGASTIKKILLVVVRHVGGSTIKKIHNALFLFVDPPTQYTAAYAYVYPEDCVGGGSTIKKIVLVVVRQSRGV